jgi:peptidylprolyl isomerase
MNRSLLILLLTTTAGVSVAQAPAKPAAKPATAGKTSTAAPGVQLPPGVPPVRAVVKSAFTLRYQEVKIGTGKEAEPNKMYKVHYTGWLASDGHKFDSSYDHRTPVVDKDGKPELGEDGKPKEGDPQPITVPQGFGRVIPGFDQGFYGMKVGGKRRLFIPWQLAYGARGRAPVIPPKADLIFDIELLDVTEPQMPPNHPGVPGMGGMPSGHPSTPASPGAPAAAPATGAPAAPATQSAPTAPPPTEKPQ